MAPVKAPFSWPNSSLSIRFSGMAAQLMADEGLVPSPAQVVQGARQQLLAGAALAQDQDAHVRGGDLLDKAADLEHFGCARDHAVQRHMAPRLYELPVLVLELGQIEGAAQDQAQLARIDRLLVEVVCASGDRTHGVLAGLVAGDHDNFGLGGEVQHFFQYGESLARPVRIRRQAEVDGDDGGNLGAELCDRGVAVGREDHVVFLERPAQLALDAGVVLHDEQGLLVTIRCHWTAALRVASSLGCASPMAGRRMRTNVPFPGALVMSSFPPSSRTNSRLS